jgi:hypothetical protein
MFKSRYVNRRPIGIFSGKSGSSFPRTADQCGMFEKFGLFGPDTNNEHAPVGAICVSVISRVSNVHEMINLIIYFHGKEKLAEQSKARISQTVGGRIMSHVPAATSASRFSKSRIFPCHSA